MKFQSPAHIWTAEEDATLLRDWAGGLPVAEMASRLGVTVGALHYRAKHKMGLPRHPASPQSCERMWPAERDQIIIDLWGKRSVSQIAFVLGVPKNAVSGRSYRLGLCQPRALGPRRRVMMKRKPHAYELIGPGDCVWPVGHVGEEGFHFCGEHRTLDSSYCAAHKKVSLVRERVMAEAAD